MIVANYLYRRNGSWRAWKAYQMRIQQTGERCECDPKGYVVSMRWVFDTGNTLYSFEEDRHDGHYGETTVAPT